MDLTITEVDRFPPGTTIGAYPQAAWQQANLPPAGAPPGAATATGIMGDGSVTLTDLAANTRYFIGGQVGGVWRYISASTLGDPVDLPSVAGSAGQVLVADPSQPNGIAWQSLSDPWLDFIKPAGAIRESINRWSGGLTNIASAITLGTPTMCAMPCLAGEILTSQKWCVGTTALTAASATNLWTFLAAADGTVLAVSTDGDVSTAWSANTQRVFPYTSPYTITADGLYYRGLVVAGGAVTPSLIGMSIGANAVFNQPPVTDGKSSTVGLTRQVALGTVLGLPTSTGNGRAYVTDL